MSTPVRCGIFRTMTDGQWLNCLFRIILMRKDSEDLSGCEGHRCRNHEHAFAGGGVAAVVYKIRLAAGMSKGGTGQPS